MASTSEEKVLPDQQAAWAAQEELSSPAATSHSYRTSEHAIAHAGTSLAEVPSNAEVTDQVIHAAESRLDHLLETKLEEMLAMKVNLKLDDMLDRKLDEILGRDTPLPSQRASKARAAHSLLVLEPETLERGVVAQGWLSLVSKEALKDPDFTPEHRRRQTFVGIRLDGKHIFPQHPEQHARSGRTVHESDMARELGLKITAIETRENKIGEDMSVRLDVETNKLKFRIWSSKAGMFKHDPDLQVKYAHLNLNLLGPFPNHVGGFFSELRGKVPMSQQSKSFLRREDRSGEGRRVFGKAQKRMA